MRSRKCLNVVWNHKEKDSKLEKLVLSTGEEIVVSKEEINSWESLDDFLMKNHSDELTFWGKFCWFFNQ